MLDFNNGDVGMSGEELILEQDKVSLVQDQRCKERKSEGYGV